MERFAFEKYFTLNIWQGSEYVFDRLNWISANPGDKKTSRKRRKEILILVSKTPLD